MKLTQNKINLFMVAQALFSPPSERRTFNWPYCPHPTTAIREANGNRVSQEKAKLPSTFVVIRLLLVQQ